jgi:hypothetical protein
MLDCVMHAYQSYFTPTFPSSAAQSGFPLVLSLSALVRDSVLPAHVSTQLNSSLLVEQL